MTDSTKEQQIDLSVLHNQNYFNRFEEVEQTVTRDQRTGRILKGPDGSDDQLYVAFTSEPVYSKLESYKAGGPKYVDMDFITIYNPADKNQSQLHTQVTDFYEWRFPTEYENFKKNKDAVMVGTPIGMFGHIVTPAQIKELEYHGIRTVEQIAGLSDSTSGPLSAYKHLRVKAAQFLDLMKEQHSKNALEEALRTEREAHNAQMKALEDKMNAILALQSAKPVVEMEDDADTEEIAPTKGKYKSSNK